MTEYTYDTFIQNILNTRGRFGCGNIYHERHHVLPKCMGGTDSKDNLIDLFADEHYMAHKLLSDENPDNTSLSRAYFLMSNLANNYQQDRYECTPEEYECARTRFSVALKELYSDKTNHPCYGKHLSEKTRKKQSERAKERLRDPRNNPMYGKHGLNNPNYGQHRSEEFCKRLSELTAARMATVDYSGANNPRAKQVIRLKDYKIYSCGKEAAEDNNIVYSTFKNKCRRRDGFMYYQDYIQTH